MGEEDIEEKCIAPDMLGLSLGVSRLCVRSIKYEGTTLRIGVVEVEPSVLTNGKWIDKAVALRAVHALDVLLIKTPRKPREISDEALAVLGIKVVAREPAEERSRAAPLRVYRGIPRIGIDQAEQIFKTKIRGQVAGGIVGALAGRRVEYIGARLAYIPMRCYILMMHRGSSIKDELAAGETKLCFELMTGSLVRVEDNGIAVDFSYAQIGELEDLAIEVYEMVGVKGEISVDEIAEIVGSSERAQIIIQMLVDYGLLEPAGMDIYRPVGPAGDYEDVVDVLKKIGAIEEGEPGCTILGPGVEEEKIDRIVSAWGSIKQVRALYYPVYVGVFRKRKGDSQLEVATLLDAVWGHRLEDFEELAASSRVIYIIDDIISEVLESGESKTICARAK